MTPEAAAIKGFYRMGTTPREIRKIIKIWELEKEIKKHGRLQNKVRLSLKQSKEHETLAEDVQ